MKLAIISDLHSNREALEAVFAHIRAQGIATLFCLGDVVGYGPEPEFCVDLVRGHASLCLMGNHDEALFHDASDFNPHARGAIEFTRARMRPKWFSSSEKKARWKWLRELPHTHREGRFLFVHGSPRDPVREYLVPRDATDRQKMAECFEKMGDATLCFVGHSHVPGVYLKSGAFLMPSEIGNEWKVSEPAMVNIGTRPTVGGSSSAPSTSRDGDKQYGCGRRRGGLLIPLPSLPALRYSTATFRNQTRSPVQGRARRRGTLGIRACASPRRGTRPRWATCSSRWPACRPYTTSRSLADDRDRNC